MTMPAMAISLLAHSSDLVLIGQTDPDLPMSAAVSYFIG
jgi:hypothetical protein